MLIDFKTARLDYQFRKFRETGEIPEYIYAGGSSGNFTQLSYWASVLCLAEARSDYLHLLGDFSTLSSKFALPYTLSKYRKGINPVTALYQELQSALFISKRSRNKFDSWIISFCKEHCTEIANALKRDIASISRYIARYTKAGREFLPLLSTLLENFRNYLYVFSEL